MRCVHLIRQRKHAARDCRLDYIRPNSHLEADRFAHRVGPVSDSICHIWFRSEKSVAKAGCFVRTAPHAGHASLACMHDGAFDVLVIENHMPEGSGLAIAERLRRYCPHLQVVRMCDTGTTIANAGIALVRPFDADDLIRAMADAADLAQMRRGATSR